MDVKHHVYLLMKRAEQRTEERAAYDTERLVVQPQGLGLTVFTQHQTHPAAPSWRYGTPGVLRWRIVRSLMLYVHSYHKDS